MAEPRFPLFPGNGCGRRVSALAAELEQVAEKTTSAPAVFAATAVFRVVVEVVVPLRSLIASVVPWAGHFIGSLLPLAPPTAAQPSAVPAAFSKELVDASLPQG
jgi:hypothetical protein